MRILQGEVLTHVTAQVHVVTFFLLLFDELADERQRFAVARLQRIVAMHSDTTAAASDQH
jgi:hypothetical protein